MIAFVEEHRGAHGVEPICKVLPIARPLPGRALPQAMSREGTYHAHRARRDDPSRLPGRAKRDAALSVEIARIHAENFGVYGARKVWRQIRREGFEVVRCTVERLMRVMGLQGAVRGKRIKTTVPDPARPCPRDKVNRQFQASAPNRLWGRPCRRHWFKPNGRLHLRGNLARRPAWSSDRWRPHAELYVAFVIDTYARRIVGWRVSGSATAGFLLDALEQAIHDRRPAKDGGLVAHSDRGSQYLAIRYTERLVEEGMEPSVGSVGKSYDNALAETVIGLFKT